MESNSSAITSNASGAHFAASLTVPFRVLLALMSVAGLFFWVYLTLIVLAWVGFGRLSAPEVVFHLSGYLYLLLSLSLACRNTSIGTLTIAGVVLNLFPAGLFIYWLSQSQGRLAPALFVPLAFIVAWFFLWVAKFSVNTNVSLRKQGVALIVLLAVLAVGALLIQPMTVDPESEARRLSLAATEAKNPEDARRLFAQALKQTNRMENPYRREEPLQTIAYHQAKAKLTEDAEATARLILTDPGRMMAYYSITRAQVENGDLLGALRTAKAHKAIEALFIVLKDEAVNKAKAGQTDGAKDVIRFAESIADDPELQGNRESRFGAIAIAQAQLGMHEEAIASAHKTTDNHASSHLVVVAITEKQAGHPDLSRASIQAAIRDITTSGKNDNDRDRAFSGLVFQLTTAGLFEEATLMANQIRQDTTKRALLSNIRSHEEVRGLRNRNSHPVKTTAQPQPKRIPALKS